MANKDSPVQDHAEADAAPSGARLSSEAADGISEAPRPAVTSLPHIEASVVRNTELERQFRIAREVLREQADVLRELAKR